MEKTTTAKDTFWNRLKSQKGSTLKQISKDLDIDQATLSHYFTGMHLPPTSWSVKICDYFGVDYATGAAEFNKAHEEWVAANLGNKKKRSHIRSRKYDVNALPAGLTYTVKEPITEVPAQLDVCVLNRDRLLRLLYGNIDYDLYNKVLNILDS